MVSLFRRLGCSLLLSLLRLIIVLCLIFAGMWFGFSRLSSLHSFLYKKVPPVNSLFGVVVLSASNAWAVGETSLEDGTEPLIERWNGVAWSVTAGPSLPQGPFRSFHRLKAVSARSSNDIWAVGCSNCSDSGSTAPLIEHWDGASWNIITSERQSVRGSLNGVSVLSPTNGWAAGSISSNGQNRPLLEQWNGATWQVFSHPGESLLGTLTGITALSSENVWVVGGFFDHGRWGPLIEHWDGAHWGIVVGPGKSRAFSSCQGSLYGITALSARNIWTVGTCVLQWNGAIWQLREGPQMPSERSASTWYAVAGASSDTLWIVGQSAQSKQAVLSQWNGKTWKFASADVSGENMGISKLFGVAMFSLKDAWAVGETSARSKTLLLHWKGENWQPISSPNPGAPQQVPVIH